MASPHQRGRRAALVADMGICLRLALGRPLHTVLLCRLWSKKERVSGGASLSLGLSASFSFVRCVCVCVPEGRRCAVRVAAWRGCAVRRFVLRACAPLTEAHGSGHAQTRNESTKRSDCSAHCVFDGHRACVTRCVHATISVLFSLSASLSSLLQRFPRALLGEVGSGGGCGAVSPPHPSALLSLLTAPPSAFSIVLPPLARSLVCACACACTSRLRLLPSLAPILQNCPARLSGDAAFICSFPSVLCFCLARTLSDLVLAREKCLAVCGKFRACTSSESICVTGC